MSTFNRRRFLQKFGIVAASPFIAKTAKAFGDTDLPLTSLRHRVLSCNIRVALAIDDAKGLGWKDRKKACLQIIKAQKPDIISLQEVFYVQADDFRDYFDDYQLFGFEGPEMDGHDHDNYFGIAKNPILYSKSRYDLVAAGTYWLSETPLIGGSKSWNTARARHANWLRLKDKRTKKEFRLINLHLDHKDQTAREKQIETVMEESAQYLPDFPQVLTGDFNVKISNPVFVIIHDHLWTDTYPAVHRALSPGYTYHNFQGEKYAKGKADGKIDFIFSKGNVKPVGAGIIKDALNGQYPSDHYFVSADIDLST